jgi:hypothetical protein
LRFGADHRLIYFAGSLGYKRANLLPAPKKAPVGVEPTMADLQSEINPTESREKQRFAGERSARRSS